MSVETEFGIELEQGTGYSQPDGTGLPRISAALDVDVHVELVVVLRLRQRLQNHNLLCPVAEVLLEIDVVDDDLPFPKHQEHASSSRFPLTRTVVLKPRSRKISCGRRGRIKGPAAPASELDGDGRRQHRS